MNSMWGFICWCTCQDTAASAQIIKMAREGSCMVHTCQCAEGVSTICTHVEIQQLCTSIIKWRGRVHEGCTLVNVPRAYLLRSVHMLRYSSCAHNQLAGEGSCMHARYACQCAEGVFTVLCTHVELQPLCT